MFAQQSVLSYGSVHKATHHAWTERTWEGKSTRILPVISKIDFVAPYLDKVPYKNKACLGIVSQKNKNCWKFHLFMIEYHVYCRFHHYT